MTAYTSEIQIAGRQRYARGWINAYISSSTNTSVTIYWQIGCEQKSAALYGQVAYAYVDGSQVGYTQGYIESSSSSWKSVCSTSGYRTINKGTSARTVSCSISTRVQPVDDIGSYTSSWYDASESISIPALASYTISYDANGGSGAPGNQTKYYGQTLTLSSTKPTRSGYKFIGWATSASATSATYSAGGAYTANSGATLYAVWSVDATCTLVFDANGGTNPPANVIHVINKTTSLPSAIPTREGYYFIGWATKSTATTATYIAGSRYTNNDFTNDATITFYAVWRISRQLFFKVPEGSNVQSIYIKVPEGQSLSTLYFKVEPTYLVTSDGYYLTDSNGNYLTVIS